MSTKTVCALLALAASVPLPAQAFNVNFTSSGAGPSATYAAAGIAGMWNNIVGTWGTHYPIADVNGVNTGVTVRNLGGSATPSADHPQTSGDDELLLDTYLATFNQVESCLRFQNLQNGTYQVITYAWFGPNPNIFARVTCDESTQGPRIIGGAWPGQVEIGTVYSVHIANVTNGVLNAHSGLFAGGTVAPLNGIQIRRLTDADGVVGLGVGGPYDVLTVNGSRGGTEHTVATPVGQPFSIEIHQPPTTTDPSHYLLLGYLGRPTALDLTPLLPPMGTLLFPPWFLNPSDPALFTMAGSLLDDLFMPVFSTDTGVNVLALPAGLPPLEITLQALIDQGGGQFRVGNAVTVELQ